MKKNEKNILQQKIVLSPQQRGWMFLSDNHMDSCVNLGGTRHEPLKHDAKKARKKANKHK